MSSNGPGKVSAPTNVQSPSGVYTVGSDIGKGLTVLELVHETPGEQAWQSEEELGPYDVLGPTMETRL